MYELTDKEYEAVNNLNAEYREAHFKQKFKENDELFIITMNDNSGPYFLEDVLESEDDSEGYAQILPVWCHERYAQDYLNSENIEGKVQASKGSVFKEQWICVLEENEALIGYMPQPLAKENSEFTVGDPTDLKA